MTQRVTEGATVMVRGYEMTASDVEWSDETDGGTGDKTGLRLVRFTGTCTARDVNNGIRATGYNGARYGGNTLAGYVE